MKKLVYSSLFVCIFLVACVNNSQTEEDSTFSVSADTLKSYILPDINGNINDYEKLLSKEQRELFSNHCTQFEKEYAIPIAMFSCDNIGDFNNFTQYADAVSEKWNGCKDNQGLIFVISNKLGEIRLISCPATEAKFSDEDFNYVINTIIFGEFRNNNFFEGLDKSLDYLGGKMKK